MLNAEQAWGGWASGHMKAVGPLQRKALVETYTPADLAFADRVFAMCEKHYEAGGDRIVECFSVRDVVELFGDHDLKAVVDYCGLVRSRALDARWGEDNDPQVEDMRKHDEWAAQYEQEAQDEEDQRRASHRWES